MVRSRNVKEKIDGDQPLEEDTSQEALLAQQEKRLHEIQNSQEASRHQLAPAGPQAEANDKPLDMEGCELEHSCDTQPAETDSVPSTLDEQQSQLPPECQDQQCAARKTAFSEQILSQHAVLADQSNSNRQAADLGQDLSEADCSRLGSIAHAQIDTQSAAAMDWVNSTSGVLAQDFLDELDPETAEQLAEVERAAQPTQRVQHAQQAQHSCVEPSPQVISAQGKPTAETTLPYVALPEPLVTSTPTTTQQGEQPASARPQDAAQPRPTTKFVKAAEVAQRGSTQHSVFDFHDPFSDACELDDDLAQLLDSAAAPRPAGPPHPALAGPGPDSAPSSQAGPQPNSGGLCHNTGLSAWSGHTTKLGSQLSLVEPRHSTVSLQPGSSVFSQAVDAMAVKAGGLMVDTAHPVNPCTRRHSGNLMALEPAGPTEETKVVGW